MGSHRRTLTEALSTNLSSQPRSKKAWGLRPLQSCRALLTAVLEESPDGGDDYDFVLWYMRRRNPKKLADLPREILDLMKKYKIL